MVQTSAKVASRLANEIRPINSFQGPSTAQTRWIMRSKQGPAGFTIVELLATNRSFS